MKRYDRNAQSEPVSVASGRAGESLSVQNRRPAAGRRFGRAAVILGLVFAAVLAGCAGCATTVIPPRAVQERVTVHLADHGRHASLVLPRGDGSWVEYAFGEWRWFALNDTGARAALRALCWRSAGTLGRRELPADRDFGADPGFVGVTLYPLEVERAAASNLLARLDERWAGQAHSAVHNPAYGLDFVRDQRAYHLFNNCNPVVAGWLRELGCRVRGPALVSKWRLKLALSPQKRPPHPIGPPRG